MVFANLFDIDISGDISVKLAERLTLITINVPSDVAEKQNRLKKVGLISEGLEGLEEEVTLLTNYLIQKSFISTIRSLIQAIQLAERLKNARREAQREQLISVVNAFLKNLYAVKIISEDGNEIMDNGDSVLTLFAGIIEEVFSKDKSLADEKIHEFLAKKQQLYVRLVLERARSLTGTISTITSNQAASEKLESLLNKMETANLDWLIETYSLHADATAGKRKLPELDNQTQRTISNAVLVRMNEKVLSFHEATEKGTPIPRFALLASWIPANRRRSIDLSQTNLLEAEQFIVELRLHISYRQQITILGSVLDRLNEFSVFLQGFEAVFSHTLREALHKHDNATLSREDAKNDALRRSGDALNVALAEMNEAAYRPMKTDSDLQSKLSKQDYDLAAEIFRLREFFSQKADTSNKVLARLMEIGNKVRVMGPMVVGEAQQRDAQFTGSLIAAVKAATDDIIKLEGGTKSIPTSSN